MKQIHTYTHEAMKTLFTLRIVHDDKQLSSSVAQASIELIDEIESKLSRYYQGSDVWQINHMQAGETLYLNQSTYDCLRIALDAYAQTQGLFDITLGKLIEHKKNTPETPAPETCGELLVDPDRPAIHCTETGREIDLGGIGKGFALDRVKTLMQDLGIESALLSSGASTQLAFGPISWEIKLNADNASLPINLQNQALSASGTAIQGSHIIAPFKPETLSYKYPRIWLVHDTASFADAWSTAAMLMEPVDLQELTQQDMEIYVEQSGSILPVE